MSRARLLALIAVAIVLFLVISGLLARAFSADGAERSAVTSLIKYEAHGDVSSAIDSVQRCASSAECRSHVTANVTALKRAGTVQILQLEPSTSFSIGSTLGTARVAFRIGDSLPVVQCVRVRRAGSVLSGLHIELLSVSAPKKGDATCP
jgi:hypothetical protein